MSRGPGRGPGPGSPAKGNRELRRATLELALTRVSQANRWVYFFSTQQPVLRPVEKKNTLADMSRGTRKRF